MPDARSEKEYSVFSTKRFLENNGLHTNLRPVFHIVEVETLGDHAMIIPDDSIGSKYNAVTTRSYANCCDTRFESHRGCGSTTNEYIIIMFIF
jgi:hypothetical protein